MKGASPIGVVIGLLLIVAGFVIIGTFLSPDWLFTLGINVKTYNMINTQMKFWFFPIGILIVIAGLFAMVKVGGP